MKQVKLNLLAIVGMMVAVGTVAFTAPREKTVFDPDPNAVTWYYQLNSMEQEDLNEPTNYGNTNPAGGECKGSQVICSILAEEDLSNLGTPALNHGDVLPGSEDYQPTLRDKF